MSNLTIARLLITSFAIVACEGAGPTKPAPSLATKITIDPSSTTLNEIGQTIQLTAEVKDQYDQLIRLTVFWSSNDPLVAVVDSSGLVTARQIGTATITARTGSVSTSANIKVRGPAVAAYITQATQSLARPVPLIAGEPALLRVFFFDESVFTTLPPVRASFFHDGNLSYTIGIAGNGARVTPETGEGSLLTSANALLPDWVIVPGLEMSIEIDLDGTQISTASGSYRIPDMGTMAVDVREVPPFDLTIVPILNPDDPDEEVIATTEGLTAESDLFWQTRDLLPIGEFDVSVREPYWTTLEPVWENRFPLLLEIDMIRRMDGVGGYYMGMMRIRGAARNPGFVTLINLLPWNIVHELGHNLSLGHAPCGTTDFLDPDYPYDDAAIGAWGYDIRTNRLVSPSTLDLMSYCEGSWISDYNFSKALNYRLSDPVRRRGALPMPRKTLLLWGGYKTDGELVLEPAFVVNASPSLPENTGPYKLEGRDVIGRNLFSMNFDMDWTAHGDGTFVFTLPVQPGWANQLSRITLSGPYGTTSIDGNEGRSAILLLDPATGKVRGILRDRIRQSQNNVSERYVLPEPGLELVTSRGIPELSAWRR